MKKETLLKLIAEKGYVISYAANLNFATYDIVTNFPPRVSYWSLAISVVGLIWSGINTHWITVPILLLSTACIYTEKYTEKIEEYAKRGKRNTDQWYALKSLYYQIKDSEDENSFQVTMTSIERIEKEFSDSTECNQILFANWYAHYKLFMEKDYHWMDEQLHFGLWKDKLPGTFKTMLIVGILLVIVIFCFNCPVISSWFES